MTLNIGVIGTGAIGREHIRRLSHTLLGSRVVAVTDINADQAARVVQELGITAEVYADGHALIAAADVQAVLVASWGRPTRSTCWLPSPPASRCSAKSRWRPPPRAAGASSKPNRPTASVWCRWASCGPTMPAIASSRRWSTPIASAHR